MYRNPFDRKLGVEIETPGSKPATMEDVEQRRRNLESLGLQDTALGRLNKRQSDWMETRDDLKDRVQGAVKGAAKDALKKGAMSAGL